MASSKPRGWLIDTNVVFELRKGPRCNRSVRAWAESVAKPACFISRVSPREIRSGIARAAGPGFPAERAAWLRDGVMAWFAERVLAVEEAVLIRWRWRVWEGTKNGYRYQQPDALLAATALAAGLGVVPRNTADFVQAGLRLLDPSVTA